MPSASRTHIARFAVLATCGLLLVGSASGCSSTQDKAKIKQAQATHILKARAERQKRKRKDKAKHGDKHGNQARSDDGNKQ